VNNKALTLSEEPKGRSFEILLDATLKSLKKDDFCTIAGETKYLLSKPELLELVKSFHPEDATELLLVLQHLIGFLWTTEKLFRGYDFESFANLSLRATDLLIRYKAIKLKKAIKSDIPHESSSEARFSSVMRRNDPQRITL
jgi:hypothetical protein